MTAFLDRKCPPEATHTTIRVLASIIWPITPAVVAAQAYQLRPMSLWPTFNEDAYPFSIREFMRVEPQVLYEGAVGAFRLSVCLWVVRRGHGVIDL